MASLNLGPYKEVYRVQKLKNGYVIVVVVRSDDVVLQSIRPINAKYNPRFKRNKLLTQTLRKTGRERFYRLLEVWRRQQ